MVVATAIGLYPDADLIAELERRGYTARRKLEVIRRGRVTVDVAQHVVTIDGHPVRHLYPMGFRLLTVLAEDCPALVRYPELIRRGMGYQRVDRAETDRLRVHIEDIRNALGDRSLIKNYPLRGPHFTGAYQLIAGPTDDD